MEAVASLLGDASASDIMQGTAASSSKGLHVAGSIVDRGNWSAQIVPGGKVTIPPGRHAGDGSVSAAALKTMALRVSDTCHDQSKVTTGSITADYTKQEDLTLTFAASEKDGWRYIEDTAVSKDKGVLWPAKVSTTAGSGTGVKAGFYVGLATSGVRASWRCCALSHGGGASLAAANSSFTTGYRFWNGSAGVADLAG